MIAKDVLWNPIVEKEYRSRMRTWRSSCAIMACVMLLGGLGFAIFGITSGINARYGGGSPVNYGVILFTILAIFQMVLLTFVTPALAAGTITGERERQTLDVLLCSPLAPIAIVWGKLAASMLYVFLLLLMLAPIFSLTFLFGGIGLRQLLIAFLVTVVAALALATLSLLFSVIFRRTIPAMVVAYVTAFLLFLGAPLAGWLIQLSSFATGSGNQPSDQAIVISEVSPLLPLLVLFADEGSGTPTQQQRSLSTISSGPFSGWEYWQLTVFLDGLICLIALGLSAYLLAPERGAPWRE